MIKDKIKHKIVNCEKIESVTSHNLYPPPLPLSQTVTLSQTPSPLWSVTYFMDGPLESNIILVMLNSLIYFFNNEFHISTQANYTTIILTTSHNILRPNDRYFTNYSLFSY